MRILRNFANTRDPRSLSVRLRRRRFELFECLLDHVPRPIAILDVGGRPEFWESMGFVDKTDVRIHVVNLIHFDSNYNNITTGISPTEFGGEQGFTRYQAVTMLERMDKNIIQPGLDEVQDNVDALDTAVDNQIAGVRDDMSTMYHAVVNGDGALETGPSSPGVTSQKQNTGRYEVDFPADISGCAWQATLVIAHDGGLLLAQPDPVSGSLGMAPLFDGSLDKSGILVETWDSAGTNADRDFTVSVICTPENNLFIGPLFPIVVLSP